MLHRSVSGFLFVLLHADLGINADNDVSFKNTPRSFAVPLTRQHKLLPTNARVTNDSSVGDGVLNLVEHFEPIRDLANLQYMGMIGLGTPQQQASVILDTGSSDLWVKPASYTSTKSSTGGTYPRVPHISIGYGMGSVSGKVLTDELEIGGEDSRDRPTVSVFPWANLAWLGVCLSFLILSCAIRKKNVCLSACFLVARWRRPTSPRETTEGTHYITLHP